MLDHPLQDIEAWIVLFSNSSLPVLRQTRRRLDQMRENIERAETRDLAHLILQDPIMAVRVLAYIQPFHGRVLQHEITTIAGAIMMSGIHPFFNRFTELPTIENMMAGEDSRALLGVLKVIRRAQRAADYAHEWAKWRHDNHPEEVRLAALLHDLAEILVWCFAPRLGLEIQAAQQANPTMRSSQAQIDVLGFTYQELLHALCNVWHLPELLRHLIDDDNAEQARVRNVTLAVRLARHSAYGWDDPALPDDFRDISELLHLSPDALKQRMGLLPDLPAELQSETPSVAQPQ